MIRIRISREMGAEKMSQAELSRRTGISAPVINEIYHQLNPRVSLEHLDRICTALQCDLSKILEHQLDPPERLKEKLQEDAEARAQKAAKAKKQKDKEQK